MASNPERLETERLILRGIYETDANEIVEWRSDPEVYKYFKAPHRITIPEHFNWYNNSYLKNESRLDWMCIERDSGRKIGVFGLALDGDTAEVNYLLAPDAQHRGYAMEAIEGLMAYAAEARGARSVVAEIHRNNRPSIQLVKNLGFTLQRAEGVFVIYGKTM